MKLFDDKATFVDVRTPDEFLEEHVRDAVNIPLDQIAIRIEEIRSFPPPVVVYCRSGNRSEFAAILLRQKGVENVLNGGSIQDVKRVLQ